MPELYFRPFACSLASRIALLEAGIEADYHQVDLASHRVVADGNDYFVISPKGQVPALRRDDGSLLTEGSAVLQWIADQRPSAELAPPPGHAERYRLQEWLSFVATEIHKAFLAPTFGPDVPDAVKDHARSRLPKALAVVSDHLAGRDVLVGDRFGVADAYLLWALLLVRFAGVDLSDWPSLDAYVERIQQRPRVREAIELERAMLQA